MMWEVTFPPKCFTLAQDSTVFKNRDICPAISIPEPRADTNGKNPHTNDKHTPASTLSNLYNIFLLNERMKTKTGGREKTKNHPTNNCA